MFACQIKDGFFCMSQKRGLLRMRDSDRPHPCQMNKSPPTDDHLLLPIATINDHSMIHTYRGTQALTPQWNVTGERGQTFTWYKILIHAKTGVFPYETPSSTNLSILCVDFKVFFVCSCTPPSHNSPYLWDFISYWSVYEYKSTVKNIYIFILDLKVHAPVYSST